MSSSFAIAGKGLGYDETVHLNRAPGCSVTVVDDGEVIFRSTGHLCGLNATETAEDYVDELAEITERNGACSLVDLAKYFGVSHVTVTRIVTRLKDEALLHTEKYSRIQFN